MDAAGTSADMSGARCLLRLRTADPRDVVTPAPFDSRRGSMGANASQGAGTVTNGAQRGAGQAKLTLSADAVLRDRMVTAVVGRSVVDKAPRVSFDLSAESTHGRRYSVETTDRGSDANGDMHVLVCDAERYSRIQQLGMELQLLRRNLQAVQEQDARDTSVATKSSPANELDVRPACSVPSVTEHRGRQDEKAVCIALNSDAQSHTHHSGCDEDASILSCFEDIQRRDCANVGHVGHATGSQSSERRSDCDNANRVRRDTSLECEDSCMAGCSLQECGVENSSSSSRHMLLQVQHDVEDLRRQVLELSSALQQSHELCKKFCSQVNCQPVAGR